MAFSRRLTLAFASIAALGLAAACNSAASDSGLDGVQSGNGASGSKSHKGGNGSGANSGSGSTTGSGSTSGDDTDTAGDDGSAGGDGIVIGGGSTNSEGEKCNGIDDNNNGQVDEGCSCTAGTKQKCYVGTPADAGIGACTFGSQTCTGTGSGEISTGTWGACLGSGKPTGEIANNGIDDDCDGKVDDTSTGAAGAGGAKGTGAAGSGGAPVGTGTAGCTPSPEICDGLDNDCDGVVDNDVPQQTCASLCGMGTESCVNGAWGACSAKQPSQEVCNGVDDDCDGQVDNGLVKVCGDASCGGSSVCTAGTWSACQCSNGGTTTVGQNCAQCVKAKCSYTDTSNNSDVAGQNCQGEYNTFVQCATDHPDQTCYSGPCDTGCDFSGTCLDVIRVAADCASDQCASECEAADSCGPKGGDESQCFGGGGDDSGFPF